MDHPIVLTFLILAIVAMMAWAAEVLKPLALAVLLSFALTPPARFLERRGVPRFLSVLLTVLLALGALGAVGYAVGRQLDQLASELPRNRERIIARVHSIMPRGSGKIEELQGLSKDLAKTLASSPIQPDKVTDVRVVNQPTFSKTIETTAGPYLEFLGSASFVLILVLFLMATREDLGDRIIRLFGYSQVSLTTRTMDEVGHRISRYLAMLASFNSALGLVVGLAMWAIGVPYAVLWGVLAGALRFIPYLGPATAFALPLIFSVAHFDTWRQPLEVIAFFVVLESVTGTFLEPIIYGRTTGVSALGLLVAAMFWTWLWGALGLLLSTPLTVCLAVLGKYVPSLRFFATLLGEEAPLKPDVRFYQRLLATDPDEATAIVDEALKKRPRAEVFDEILIPALSRAERDHARDELDDRDRAFVWRVVGDLVDDLEGTPDLSLESLAPATDAVATLPASRVLGVATNDQADALALRMLAQLLAPHGCTMEVVADTESPLALADRVAEHEPALVVLSHLPPVGLTSARHLVRRLRARLHSLPIWVGRWGEGGDTEDVSERLAAVGASGVVFSLAQARDRVLEALRPKAEADRLPLAPVGT
jgi:predicted PurR-regulated permease PerM